MRLRAVHVFNSSVVSGPEILVVPSLAQIDCDCTVVWLKESRLTQSQPVENFSKQFGLRTEVVEVQKRYDKGAIGVLNAVLRRLDPAIVHAHDAKASLYSLKACSTLPSVRMVSTHHGVRGRSGAVARFYERFYRHLILPHYDLVLSVCGSDKAILEISAGLKDKVQVHWNGVDSPVSQPFDRARAQAAIRDGWEARFPDDAVVIGIVGRLAPEKQIGFAIEVFNEVVQRYPTLALHFVVVGEGPLRNDLENQVQKLGLQERVHFFGYRASFGREMAGLDLLMSLSKAEGLPINVLEAGFSKTPVLCTRIDGLADLFPPGVGYPALEMGATAAELGAELERLVLDPKLRMQIGEKFYERVNRSFSGAAWRLRLKELYQQLVS